MRIKVKRLFDRWLMALLLLSWLPFTSFAVLAQAQHPAPVQSGALPEMTAAAVRDWADQLFEQALGERRYSGAVVSFVENGEMSFSKGYGFADYVAGTPVDPAQTTFRVGSITKTFTATAIAQLMEQGLIDSLDDPANRYLKRLQIPEIDGHRITLKELITHSAGFENWVFHMATDSTLELPLSAEELKAFEGEVVNPPGRYSSYNNYGTALLGVIVEDVSGLPIAQYLERHIFQPLGMQNSTLNMAPEPTPGLGQPYGFLPNGEALPIPHRTVHPFYAPVGGINATAEDMARFMLAHLDTSQSSENRLMSAERLAQMHTRIAGNHELSSGFGMIFFTWDWNDQKMIVHGGDWPGTHSGMVLFPQLNTGLFFSLMAEFPEVPVLESITGSERLMPVDGLVVGTPLSNVGVLVNLFTHFLGPLKPPGAAHVPDSDLSEFAGNFIGQSAPHSGMDIMLNFTSPFQTVRVEAAPEALLINGKPYQHVAPDVFWSDEVKMSLDSYFLDSPIYMFSRDEQGAVEFLTPQIGFDAWVRKGALETPSTWLMAWGGLTLFLLSGLLVIFYPRVSQFPMAKWLPPLIAAMLLSMPAVLLVGYGEGESLVNDLFFGYATRFFSFAVMGNLVIVLALVSAWYTLKAWKEPFWSGQRGGWLLRLHYSLLSLAALMLIPVFSYMNLLPV